MLEILIEIVLSLVVTGVGYWGMLIFLNERGTQHVSILKNIKFKLIYFGVVSFICAMFIYLFQTTYVNTTTLHQLKLLVLILILIPTAVVDYFVQLIPNIFMLGALGIRMIIYLIEFIISPEYIWITIKDNLLAVAIIGGFFLLVLLLFKNSIGMGDIKLFAIMGLYQGFFGAINSVFFSLVVSFFSALFLLVTKKKSKKDAISFAPSILIGTIVGISLSGI